MSCINICLFKHVACVHFCVSCKAIIYLLPFSQQLTPAWFFSLCISSLLKGAARNKNGISLQLSHSDEHRPQVEQVLMYLTDLSDEERTRIVKDQCTLESGLLCPCIEVLPSSELDRTVPRMYILLMVHALVDILLHKLYSLCIDTFEVVVLSLGHHCCGRCSRW